MKRQLTDTAVKNAKPKVKGYALSDGGGLYLFVSPTGSRSWRYKYRIGGREDRFTIGTYPDVSLKVAREEHQRARELVRNGIRPLDQRKSDIATNTASAKNTFASLAGEWLELHSKRLSATYRTQAERTLKTYAFPVFGTLPIKLVRPMHIVSAMKRAEDNNAKTVALLIRQLCSQIFRYAIAHGAVEVDPAAGLRGVVVRDQVQHHDHLQEADIPKFKAALSKFSGYRETTIAMELLLRTFVRTGELRKARWDEFNFDTRTWTIPAERMKMRRKHVVPLSNQVVSLLEELRTWTGGRPFLFPNHRRPTEQMSPTTLNRALDRMGYAGRLSAHGFRGTASTILNSMGKPSHVIELQLSHTEKNSVKAAYDHSEHLPERRELMQFWSDHLDSLPTLAE